MPAAHLCNGNHLHLRVELLFFNLLVDSELLQFGLSCNPTNRRRCDERQNSNTISGQRQQYLSGMAGLEATDQ